jgi:hypothetical protein
MGFNQLQPPSGPFSLAPGASTRIWVWYGSGGPGQQMGDDHGAQWIMADCVDVDAAVPLLSLPASLVVSDFTKVREFWSGYDEATNTYYIDFALTVVRYEVTVRNTSRDVVYFTVQGGGNI